MTADELAQALHPRGPLGLPDSPEVCAARRAELARATAPSTRRRAAVDRAREAAGR